MSGNLIVYDPDSMLEIWRTDVLGAAGMHSALAIEDLDQAVTRSSTSPACGVSGGSRSRRHTMRTPLAMFVLCSVPLVAQQTWLVNCQNVPGTDFLDLPQAVAAAAPGDTILVYSSCLFPAGTYSAATIDKPLSIVGISYGPVPPPGGALMPGVAVFEGRFTISGIPSGSRVLLSNIALAWPTTVLPGTGLVIADCDGEVVLEDLRADEGPWPGHVFDVDRSAGVVFRGCSISLSGSPIRVTDSTLLMTTTLVEQAFHGAPTNPPGMLLQNSTVTMIGSIVYGFPSTSLGIPNPTPGVELHDSTLRIGPATTVYGGPTGFGGRGHGYWAPNPQTSIVQLDPRGTVDMISTAIQPQPTQTAIDSTFHSWVTADQLYGVTVAGPSNGFALLLFGDLIPSTPTPFGPLSIDPLSAYGVDLVPLPASNGSHSLIFLCPPNAPVAQGFAFQSLTLSPAGTFGLTVPSPLTVAWPLGVVPQ